MRVQGQPEYRHPTQILNASTLLGENSSDDQEKIQILLAASKEPPQSGGTISIHQRRITD